MEEDQYHSLRDNGDDNRRESDESGYDSDATIPYGDLDDDEYKDIILLTDFDNKRMC